MKELSVKRRTVFVEIETMFVQNTAYYRYVVSPANFTTIMEIDWLIILTSFNRLLLVFILSFLIRSIAPNDLG
jgi:hypothetical protein